MLKVNNRSTRKRCEICSKLTIKTLFEKTNTFNDFFSQQCHPVSNDSILALIPSVNTLLLHRSRIK